VRGGHQERDRRAGTQPVASAVGMAAAAAATDADRHVQVPRVAALAGRLVDAATRWGASETVPAERRTAGHVHLRFAGLDAEALLFLLDEGGVAASAASACASGAQQASSVVEALGVDPTGSVRFSLGHSTTDAEIDHAIAVIDGAVGRLR
jgi:cysteine desulfurase